MAVSSTTVPRSEGRSGRGCSSWSPSSNVVAHYTCHVSTCAQAPVPLHCHIECHHTFIQAKFGCILCIRFLAQVETKSVSEVSKSDMKSGWRGDARQGTAPANERSLSHMATSKYCLYHMACVQSYHMACVQSRCVLVYILARHAAHTQFRACRQRMPVQVALYAGLAITHPTPPDPTLIPPHPSLPYPNQPNPTQPNPTHPHPTPPHPTPPQPQPHPQPHPNPLLTVSSSQAGVWTWS